MCKVWLKSLVVFHGIVCSFYWGCDTLYRYMVVFFRFPGNKNVKLKNVCTGRACKMHMLAAWTFTTYIFYFPMGPNNCNITFFWSRSNIVILHFSPPYPWKKVILQFSAPPGLRGRDGIIGFDLSSINPTWHCDGTFLYMTFCVSAQVVWGGRQNALQVLGLHGCCYWNPIQAVNDAPAIVTDDSRLFSYPTGTPTVCTCGRWKFEMFSSAVSQHVRRVIYIVW